MRRSPRVALTATAASAVLAGAGGALVLGPLASRTSTVGPAPTTFAADQLVDSGPAADPAPLHEAVSRLAREAAALKAELAALRHRQDTVAPAAAPATSTPRSVARAVTRAPARRVVAKAPAVHTRTGASAASGEQEGKDD